MEKKFENVDAQETFTRSLLLRGLRSAWKHHEEEQTLAEAPMKKNEPKMKSKQDFDMK